MKRRALLAAITASGIAGLAGCSSTLAASDRPADDDRIASTLTEIEIVLLDDAGTDESVTWVSSDAITDAPLLVDAMASALDATQEERGTLRSDAHDYQYPVVWFPVDEYDRATIHQAVRRYLDLPYSTPDAAPRGVYVRYESRPLIVRLQTISEIE